jgi:hypothetical protein
VLPAGTGVACSSWTCNHGEGPDLLFNIEYRRWQVHKVELAQPYCIALCWRPWHSNSFLFLMAANCFNGCFQILFFASLLLCRCVY